VPFTFDDPGFSHVPYECYTPNPCHVTLFDHSKIESRLAIQPAMPINYNEESIVSVGNNSKPRWRVVALLILHTRCTKYHSLRAEEIKYIEINIRRSSKDR